MAEPSDDGFTLIEVVVVVAILGLISLVIGFAITTVLRVTPTTESQVSDARSLQGLTAWFANDAASAERSAASVRLNPSSLGCASVTAAGTNLVEFQWTVDEPATTTFLAAYRIEPDGADRTIRRYECSGSGTPPPSGYSGTTAQKLTGPLAAVSNVTATSGFDQIMLELESLDGTALQIEATPRNPSVTLAPATTAPPVTLPSEPTPCAVTFDSATWGPVRRWNPAPGVVKIVAPVDLTVTVSGETCGTITIGYNTGIEDWHQTVTWSGNSGSVTIPKGYNNPATPQWDAGNHSIRVYNNCPDPCATPPLDTSTLTVELTVL